MFKICSAARGSALLTLMLLVVSARTSGQQGKPSAPAQAPVSEGYLAPIEGDYLIGNFRFRSGETLPELWPPSAGTRLMRDLDEDDVVHPVDRKVHRILAHLVDSSDDEMLRESARPLMLTMPPVREWPAERVAALHDWASLVLMRCEHH
jgi:hypothetical protein